MWDVIHCTPENAGLLRGWYLWHSTRGTDDATRCRTKRQALALLKQRLLEPTRARIEVVDGRARWIPFAGE